MNIKFSQLSSVVTLSASNILPIVQGNYTKKVTVSGLLDCSLFTKGKVNLSRLSGAGTFTLTNTIVISGKKTLDINNNLKVSGLTTLSGGANINGPIGFFGSSPRSQLPAIMDAASNSDVINKFNILLSNLRSIGLLET